MTRKLKMEIQCMMRIFVRVLFTASMAWGQLATGTIVGTVEDPSNAAVAGAGVTAVHTGTGRTRQTTTNEHGDFVFNSLEPGVYTLTFTAVSRRKHSKMWC